MINDHKLKADVTEELSWEPSIQADHIGVAADRGVVTLSGHVPSYWQKAAAERAVSRVKGVKAIAEELEVRLSSDVKHHDDEIAAAVVNRLTWHPSIPNDAVKVKVENGTVTLTGMVEYHYQHDIIASSIRSIAGVIAVINNVKVKLRPDTSAIKNDINHALHRSYFSRDQMSVSAEGGKVRLTGNVNNWRDRELAATTAWRANGTTSVINDLRVN